jgi:hypothetical protein
VIVSRVIFHNNNDAFAVTVLRRVLSALERRVTLLINDYILSKCRRGDISTVDMHSSVAVRCHDDSVLGREDKDGEGVEGAIGGRTFRWQRPWRWLVVSVLE